MSAVRQCDACGQEFAQDRSEIPNTRLTEEKCQNGRHEGPFTRTVVTQPQEAAPLAGSSNVATFNCVVKFIHATVKFHGVELNLDALQDLIETSWPHFAVMKYSLYYCREKEEIVVSDTGKLRELVVDKNSSHTFKVKKECLGFSEYCDKKRAVETLTKLKAATVDSSKIAESDDNFTLQNTEQWDELIEKESRVIQVELLRRAKKISLSAGVSEYTKREFISPVLLGSLQLIEGVMMMCEKKIVGTFGNGPVDYSLIYKNLNIVLTEAKKEDIEGGFIQNLVQQEASHESLAFAILPNEFKSNNIPRYERKRKFHETVDEIACLPSYGIITDGNSWVFSKIVRQPKLNRSYIYKSSPQILLLRPKDTEIEVQLLQIKEIVKRIVAICSKQIEVVDTNPVLASVLTESTAIPTYESGLVESYESIKRWKRSDQDDNGEEDEEDY